MTSKEKAKELVNKYFHYPKPILKSYEIAKGKKCALIAVDEIINFIPSNPSKELREVSIKYWEEVKTEIEKL